ncbi:hypothetical protein BaRGS_00031344, partial [Batillaria attramentaria]
IKRDLLKNRKSPSSSESVLSGVAPVEDNGLWIWTRPKQTWAGPVEWMREDPAFTGRCDQQTWSEKPAVTPGQL